MVYFSSGSLHQTCGGSLSGPSGEISSPGYPSGYSANLNCVWTIEVAPNQVIQLTVQQFDLQDSASCSSDSLTVYDGIQSSVNELLSPSCGSQVKWPSYPSTILSTGNLMTVVFTSDDTFTAPGFRARFQQVPPREEFFLIVDASNSKIYKQNRLGTNAEELLVAGLQNPVAVDFDPVERKVYFTDVVAKFIGRINIDGSDQETIATDMVDVPDGLVVDSLGRILYWTDTGNDMITKSNLDGSGRTVFISTDLLEPRDIIIYQEGRYVYWSDWGSNPKIERCLFDGSGRETIITDGLGWPNGLALDEYESKLYWVDARLNKIERSNFDGSQRQLLEDFDSNDVHPFSIVVLETAIFWTDWLTQGVDVTDRNFQNEATTLHVAGIRTRLHDMVYFSSGSLHQTCGGSLTGPSGEISSPGYPSGYSANLNCVWTIEVAQDQVIQLTIQQFDLQDSASCSSDSLTVYDGIQSSVNELLSSSCGSQIKWPSYPSTLLSTGTLMTVVFTSDDTLAATGFRATFQQVPPREEFFLIVDSSNSKIYKQNRLGTNAEDLMVSGLQNPVAVDFDPVERKVYFSDVVAKFIGRINIDGSDQETIATDMVDVPDGLFVDSLRRILYWTDTGNDMITKSNLDGSGRNVFISTDLDQPRDIIVYQEGGYVYWTDWGSNPKIERCLFDGSGRETIINEGLGWPNGLALDEYESKLYWADASLNKIERSNFDGSQRQLLEDFDSNDVHPYSIVVLETAIFWTDWLRQGVDFTDRNFQNEATTFYVAGTRTRLTDIIYFSSESLDSGTIRLVGGSSQYEGRVEIFHDGQWGTVCDDNWHDLDAAVVCRQLGYSGDAFASSNAAFGQGSGRIWLDDVSCTGNEKMLQECGSNGWGSHNCGHHEDAGVRCLVNELNCTFDHDTCDFSQMAEDDFDWSRRQGATPSSGTGPSVDHTTGTGYYMYIEVTGREAYSTARLISSPQGATNDQGVCLSFFYHMYGATINTLNVYLSSGGNEGLIFTRSNNLGDNWWQATIQLRSSSTWQIIFEGTRGIDYTGDIAIDDISIVPGPCPSRELNCTFDYDTCGYSQMAEDDFDWTRRQGSTPSSSTGPSEDHTTGTGYYMYIEATSREENSAARLISSPQDATDDQGLCLVFFYHMYGATINTLKVYLSSGGNEQLIFTRSSNQGDSWLRATAQFRSSLTWRIIFEGRRGTEYTGDIAIDDISVFPGSC